MVVGAYFPAAGQASASRSARASANRGRAAHRRPVATPRLSQKSGGRIARGPRPGSRAAPRGRRTRGFEQPARGRRRRGGRRPRTGCRGSPLERRVGRTGDLPVDDAARHDRAPRREALGQRRATRPRRTGEGPGPRRAAPAASSSRASAEPPATISGAEPGGAEGFRRRLSDRAAARALDERAQRRLRGAVEHLRDGDPAREEDEVERVLRATAPRARPSRRRGSRARRPRRADSGTPRGTASRPSARRGRAAGVTPARSPTRAAAPRARSVSAARRPIDSASAVAPESDARSAVAPSSEKHRAHELQPRSPGARAARDRRAAARFEAPPETPAPRGPPAWDAGWSRRRTALRRRVAARHDRERSLPDGRKEHGLVEHVGDLIEAPEPRQARAGQDDRVEAALAQAPDARVHVAARLDDLEVRTGAPELRAAARAGGPDARAAGKVGERPPRLRDEDVARVFPLGNRREDQSFRQRRGHVLEAVHGEVDAAVEQGLVELAREVSLPGDRARPPPRAGRRSSAPPRSRPSPRRAHAVTIAAWASDSALPRAPSRSFMSRGRRGGGRPRRGRACARRRSRT